MTSITDFIKQSDRWLHNTGPSQHSVISSRARLARNLARVPFAPRARSEQLRAVLEQIDDAIAKCPSLSDFRRLTISDVNSLHRLYLKESHLLSAEFEQGGDYRVIYISPDYRISLMINEEDHLRMQCLDTGLQVGKVLAIINEVAEELDGHLNFARHRRFGYLTACPTNVGTGLRLSVMMHLPGLVLTSRHDEVMEDVAKYGLTVRGIYGENSDHLGDFFQISNEVSMGKTQEELLDVLNNMAQQVLEEELLSREALFDQKPLIVKDLIFRALAVLQNACIIDSVEALSHLSKIRLGIDQGMFRSLSHSDLSFLMTEIQPAHLQCSEGGQLPVEVRDSHRAMLLHRRLRSVACN